MMGSPLKIGMQPPFKAAHRYWVATLWEARRWPHKTNSHIANLLKQIQKESGE